MEVILTQDVDKFGKTGSVVKVKRGFARNFLFPHRLAIPATPVNLKKIEQEKERISNVRQREKQRVLDLGNRINGLSLTIPVATHNDEELYGSIGAHDIIEALNQEGILEVTKEAVILTEPIKSIGVYDVTIKLHSEVSAKIKVWVVKR